MNQYFLSRAAEDIDHATPANHSTGVLTPRRPAKILKTRIVFPALEKVGFTTRIIERRLRADIRSSEESHVALLGADNLDTRRLTSDVGWSLAVDVGLGSEPRDFSSMLLHRFPGQKSSHDIAAWKTLPSPTVILDSVAFTELTRHPDQCGVIELAGKAVGASFVGVIAACLAVSETLCNLYGGQSHDLLTVDLFTDTTRCSPLPGPSSPLVHP